jgi:hypothetical protein
VFEMQYGSVRIECFGRILVAYNALLGECLESNLQGGFGGFEQTWYGSIAALKRLSV